MRVYNGTSLSHYFYRPVAPPLNGPFRLLRKETPVTVLEIFGAHCPGIVSRVALTK